MLSKYAVSPQSARCVDENMMITAYFTFFPFIKFRKVSPFSCDTIFYCDHIDTHTPSSLLGMETSQLVSLWCTVLA